MLPTTSSPVTKYHLHKTVSVTETESKTSFKKYSPEQGLRNSKDSLTKELLPEQAGKVTLAPGQVSQNFAIPTVNKGSEGQPPEKREGYEAGSYNPGRNMAGFSCPIGCTKFVTIGYPLQQQSGESSKMCESPCPLSCICTPLNEMDQLSRMQQGYPMQYTSQSPAANGIQFIDPNQRQEQLRMQLSGPNSKPQSAPLFRSPGQVSQLQQPYPEAQTGVYQSPMNYPFYPAAPSSGQSYMAHNGNMYGIQQNTAQAMYSSAMMTEAPYDYSGSDPNGCDRLCDQRQVIGTSMQDFILLSGNDKQAMRPESQWDQQRMQRAPNQYEGQSGAQQNPYMRNPYLSKQVRIQNDVVDYSSQPLSDTIQTRATPTLATHRAIQTDGQQMGQDAAFNCSYNKQLYSTQYSQRGIPKDDRAMPSRPEEDHLTNLKFLKQNEIFRNLKDDELHSIIASLPPGINLNELIQAIDRSPELKRLIEDMIPLDCDHLARRTENLDQQRNAYQDKVESTAQFGQTMGFNIAETSGPSSPLRAIHSKSTIKFIEQTVRISPETKFSPPFSEGKSNFAQMNHFPTTGAVVASESQTFTLNPAQKSQVNVNATANNSAIAPTLKNFKTSRVGSDTRFAQREVSFRTPTSNSRLTYNEKDNPRNQVITAVNTDWTGEAKCQENVLVVNNSEWAASNVRKEIVTQQKTRIGNENSGLSSAARAQAQGPLPLNMQTGRNANCPCKEPAAGRALPNSSENQEPSAGRAPPNSRENQEPTSVLYTEKSRIITDQQQVFNIKSQYLANDESDWWVGIRHFLADEKGERKTAASQPGVYQQQQQPTSVEYPSVPIQFKDKPNKSANTNGERTSGYPRYDGPADRKWNSAPTPTPLNEVTIRPLNIEQLSETGRRQDTPFPSFSEQTGNALLQNSDIPSARRADEEHSKAPMSQYQDSNNSGGGGNSEQQSGSTSYGYTMQAVKSRTIFQKEQTYNSTQIVNDTWDSCAMSSQESRATTMGSQSIPTCTPPVPCQVAADQSRASTNNPLLDSESCNNPLSKTATSKSLCRSKTECVSVCKTTSEMNPKVETPDDCKGKKLSKLEVMPTKSMVSLEVCNSSPSCSQAKQLLICAQKLLLDAAKNLKSPDCCCPDSPVVPKPRKIKVAPVSRCNNRKPCQDNIIKAHPLPSYYTRRRRESCSSVDKATSSQASPQLDISACLTQLEKIVKSCTKGKGSSGSKDHNKAPCGRQAVLRSDSSNKPSGKSKGLKMAGILFRETENDSCIVAVPDAGGKSGSQGNDCFVFKESDCFSCSSQLGSEANQSWRLFTPNDAQNHNPQQMAQNVQDLNIMTLGQQVCSFGDNLNQLLQLKKPAFCSLPKLPAISALEDSFCIKLPPATVISPHFSVDNSFIRTPPRSPIHRDGNGNHTFEERRKSSENSTSGTPPQSRRIQGSFQRTRISVCSDDRNNSKPHSGGSQGLKRKKNEAAEGASKVEKQKVHKLKDTSAFKKQTLSSESPPYGSQPHPQPPDLLMSPPLFGSSRTADSNNTAWRPLSPPWNANRLPPGNKAVPELPNPRNNTLLPSSAPYNCNGLPPGNKAAPQLPNSKNMEPSSAQQYGIGLPPGNVAGPQVSGSNNTEFMPSSAPQNRNGLPPGDNAETLFPDSELHRQAARASSRSHKSAQSDNENALLQRKQSNLNELLQTKRPEAEELDRLLNNMPLKLPTAEMRTSAAGKYVPNKQRSNGNKSTGREIAKGIPDDCSIDNVKCKWGEKVYIGAENNKRGTYRIPPDREGITRNSTNPDNNLLSSAHEITSTNTSGTPVPMTNRGTGADRQAATSATSNTGLFKVVDRQNGTVAVPPVCPTRPTTNECKVFPGQNTSVVPGRPNAQCRVSMQQDMCRWEYRINPNEKRGCNNEGNAAGFPARLMENQQALTQYPCSLRPPFPLPMGEDCNRPGLREPSLSSWKRRRRVRRRKNSDSVYEIITYNVP